MKDCLVNRFEMNVRQLWGESGLAWMAALPALVADLTQHWQLQHLQPVTNLSYNYVLTGVRSDDDLAVVLKLGYDVDEIKKEAAALQVYAGRGCVQLLARDLELGALLLQRVVPGQSLKTFFPGHDVRAMECTIAVMQQLHTALVPSVTTTFASVADWLQGLHTAHAVRKLSGYHLQKAQSLAQDLLQSAGPAVLLHGDLHHDNILASANDRWLAIDPKGVWGEAIYEVGAFVRNPVPELLNQKNASQLIAQRIEFFADQLHADEQRVKAWCYVQAVLADCWAAEQSDDGALWLAEAAIIDKL